MPEPSVDKAARVLCTRVHPTYLLGPCTLCKRAVAVLADAGLMRLDPPARPYGFGLLRSSDDEADLTPITGGLDSDTECIDAPDFRSDKETRDA